MSRMNRSNQSKSVATAVATKCGILAAALLAGCQLSDPGFSARLDRLIEISGGNNRPADFYDDHYYTGDDETSNPPHQRNTAADDVATAAPIPETDP